MDSNSNCAEEIIIPEAINKMQPLPNFQEEEFHLIYEMKINYLLKKLPALLCLTIFLEIIKFSSSTWNPDKFKST